jgi:flavin-dependent dehydrogenase
VAALSKTPDVFVIGGGPAGLAAAIAACRKGFSVTLADGAEPPIDKPCGEGLLSESVEALHQLGVSLTAVNGFLLRGIRFVAGNVNFAADFPQGYGLGIRRPHLHDILLQHAEKLGVHFLWKTPVCGIGPREVRTVRGTFNPRWIVGADGIASRVRRWSGLEVVRWRQQRYAVRRHYRLQPWTDYAEIHWGRHTQAYVTPVSSEEVCVVLIAEELHNTNFETALAEFPQLQRRLAGATIAGREQGTITAMQSLRHVSSGNIALIGDASGSVDAITAEGLRLGFAQALALADAIEAHDLSRYERAHKQLARRPIWMGKLMLQLARSTWLRERAMRTMADNPKLFERLLAIHIGQSTPKNILATGAQLGWQFLAA